MARVVPRSGRKESNNPVFSRRLLQKMVCQVLDREGVRFSETERSFEDQCWRIFRVFQFLIPAVVVASGVPVSLYGLGSCKMVETGTGPKFRFRFPRGLLNDVLKQVKVAKSKTGRRTTLSRFWRALDLFLVQERGIDSPLQADYVELDFDD
jgi:hypothetical protein